MSRGDWWTKAQTETLLACVNTGATLDEAAKATERTPGSCVEKVHNMRIPLPKTWWKRTPKSARAKPYGTAGFGDAHLSGKTLPDPKRADRVLRRFTFQDEP